MRDNNNLSISIRRKARRSMCHNAFLWGIGNGLFSTSLITYLIRDICRGESSAAVSATIAWIIAAPRLFGVLRVLTPTLVEFIGSRKVFCVGCFFVAPLVLCGIPLLLPKMVHSRGVLPMLVLFWCVYHLVEYFGMVALFAWCGDLISERIRGRFFGRRDAWMIAGQTIGFLYAGIYSYGMIESMPKTAPRWEAYLQPACLGLVYFFMSVIPLTTIPEISWKRSEGGLRQRLLEILQPAFDFRFVLFVLFGCWVQMSIGVSQATQMHFSIFTLGVSMLVGLGFQTTTRIGQWGIGPTTGRYIDRLGNLGVMSICLFIVSFGSLFYAVAQKPTWWLLFGAAVVWIFWVGVNIGISKTILDFAPPSDRAAYFAFYFAATTLTLAVSTLLGGVIFGAAHHDRLSFFVSWILRLLAIPILWLAVKHGRFRCSS